MSHQINPKSYSSPVQQVPSLGSQPASRLIRRSVVLQRTGLSRSALYRAIEQGEFPRQVTISTNSVAWLEAEVEAWIQTRLAQRDSRGQQP